MSFEQSLQDARQWASSFIGDEGGMTLIEYGLLAGMITFAIVTLLTSMGGSLITAFTSVNSDLQSAISSIQP